MITAYIPADVLSTFHPGERSQRISRLLSDNSVGSIYYELAEGLRLRGENSSHKSAAIKTSLSLTPAAETILRAACDRYGLSPSLVITLLIEGSATN